MVAISFQDYWDRVGSRVQVESHEERARLAWDACKWAMKPYVPVPTVLCGMGPCPTGIEGPSGPTGHTVHKP
jgi:hypothetical protein